MTVFKSLMTSICFVCMFACTDCNAIHGIDISSLPVRENMAESYLSSVEVYNEEGRTIGAGVIIESGGGTPMKVLTAAHVVDDMDAVTIGITYTLDKKEMYVAKIDKVLDLALLVAVEPENKSGPYVNLARHGSKIGDPIWVIGNPSGEPRVVTSGIISQNKMYVVSANNDFIIRHMYRITADIFGGNSGGGLFNDSGELIGIVVQMQLAVGRIIVIDEEGNARKLDDAFTLYPEPGAFFAVALEDILSFLKA